MHDTRPLRRAILAFAALCLHWYVLACRPHRKGWIARNAEFRNRGLWRMQGCSSGPPQTAPFFNLDQATTLEEYVACAISCAEVGWRRLCHLLCKGWMVTVGASNSCTPLKSVSKLHSTVLELLRQGKWKNCYPRAKILRPV